MPSSRPAARIITLPVLEDGADERARPRRRHYGRWRAASLIGVHVLAAIHMAHWHLTGRTVAPLELNEVMHTLELGIVTAGFVFMTLIVVSTAIFGRFFCSWACHILALQDLCAWILGRLGIRAKAVRSRVLLFVAPGAMLYMFVWPQAKRLFEGRALPTLHLRDDTAGWASFVTDDFWRNLPGAGVALLTLAVCGFVIVYVLGSRSFCLYACPYGAVFGLMDRVAPGRIKVDPDTCNACGVCTGVCESHVRVHEEIAVHGSVVDPACLKDLDCVAACPTEALSYGWTRPSLWRSLRPGRRRLAYDFTLAEDVLMAVVFLAVLAILRGLYGVMPLLLSLAIGAIVAYLAVVLVRLGSRPSVRFNAIQLKLKGRITPAGRGFACVSGLLAGLFVHSGVIRYHEHCGLGALARGAERQRAGDPAGLAAAAQRAVRHLRVCDRWGLLTSPGHDGRLASAYWAIGDAPAAEGHWRKAIDRDPANHDARLELAGALALRGRGDFAMPLLQEVISARPRSETDAGHYAAMRAIAWDQLAAHAVAAGDSEQAQRAIDAAQRERSAASRP